MADKNKKPYSIRIRGEVNPAVSTIIERVEQKQAKVKTAPRPVKLPTGIPKKVVKQLKKTKHTVKLTPQDITNVTKDLLTKTRQGVKEGAKDLLKVSPEAGKVPDYDKLAPGSVPKPQGPYVTSSVRPPVVKPPTPKAKEEKPKYRPYAFDREAVAAASEKARSAAFHKAEVKELESRGALVDPPEREYTKRHLDDNKVQRSLKKLHDFEAKLNTATSSNVVSDFIDKAPYVVGRTLKVISDKYTESIEESRAEEEKKKWHPNDPQVVRQSAPSGSLNKAWDSVTKFFSSGDDKPQPVAKEVVKKAVSPLADDAPPPKNGNGSSKNSGVKVKTMLKKPVVFKAQRGGGSNEGPFLGPKTQHWQRSSKSRSISTYKPSGPMTRNKDDQIATLHKSREGAKDELKKDKPSAISQGIANLFGAKYTPGHRDPTTGEMTTSPHAKFNPKTDPVKALYERKKRKEKGWSNTAFPK